MSEIDPQYRFTSGPLRSTVIIELHTHYATRVWSGRPGKPDEDIHPIIGITRFISLMNTLRLDSLADNPYADMWILRMEERLLAAREEMDLLIGGMQKVFSQIPETMTVEGSASIQPARFPVFASTQLGFMAIYLLTDFDELMRKTLLAHHMALLTPDEKKTLRQKAGHQIRSTLVLAQRYRRFPVTRQDIREGNGRAKEAEALVGAVPEDILDGSRRSAYSPPLRQSAGESVIGTDKAQSSAPVSGPAITSVGPDLAKEDEPNLADDEVDDGESDD